MRWLLISALAATSPQLATVPSPLPCSARERVNIEFQDADIHHVMRTLAEIGRVNIVVEKGVSGRVTATFRSTTWDVALRTILRSQGLTAERDGNVIYVHPAD